MTEVTYKIDELARAAGISARTVRYYVQRGLLRAPMFRGRDTVYDGGHLVRLRAIRRLQQAFFPLDAIAVELERLPESELARIADGEDLPPHRSAGGEAPADVPRAELGGPVASREGRTFPRRTFRRIEIAPGVELSIADDAPRESVIVAERILREL